MEVTEQAKDYCEGYDCCKGCPFVGNECVAPVSDAKFDSWIDKMNEFIKLECEK